MAFTETQISTGAVNFPGAGFPISIRSAVTSSPDERLKLDHGFGMRSNAIFWSGSPVTMFMIVVVTAMSGSYACDRCAVQRDCCGQRDLQFHPLVPECGSTNRSIPNERGIPPGQ